LHRAGQDADAQKLPQKVRCRISVHFFIPMAFFDLSATTEIVRFYQPVNLSVTHPTKASLGLLRHKKGAPDDRTGTAAGHQNPSRLKQLKE
jgi:hypothetical protein